MSAAPFTRRIPKRFKKTITFDGTAGNGAVGTVAIGTVTGGILFTHLTIRCLTDLTGAATLEMGVAGNTAALVAQLADATGVDAGDFWIGTTTPAGVAAAIVDKTVTGNIILTIASTAVLTGSIEIVGYWLPLSDTGNLA